MPFRDAPKATKAGREDDWKKNTVGMNQRIVEGERAAGSGDPSSDRLWRKKAIG